LIGIIISTFKNPSTVNMLNSLAVFPVAMLSGLWWPMSMMPNWLQVFGKLLPTYAISNVINNVIFNKALQLSNIVNLISWFVGLLLVIIVLTKLVPRQELQSE
jgi:ABC-2 type transport system permease protein